VLPRQGAAFQSIARLARAISETGATPALRAELQARVARAYSLDRDALAHVLATFPIVADLERQAALEAFSAMEDAI